MQKVIFSNGKIIYADEIQGSTYNGRETLIFIISGDNTKFDELKNIFLDKKATEIIIVEYEDVDGSIQQNVQIGFIVPVSLSYASNSTEPNLYKYSMTLGKRTQVEAEYAELRADITEISETVEQIKHELESLSKK